MAMTEGSEIKIGDQGHSLGDMNVLARGPYDEPVGRVNSHRGITNEKIHDRDESRGVVRKEGSAGKR